MFASFSYEARFLPLRPFPIFLLHRIGRKPQPKNPVLIIWKLEDEETLRRSKSEIDRADTNAWMLRLMLIPICRHHVAIGASIAKKTALSGSFFAASIVFGKSKKADYYAIVGRDL